MPRFSIGRDTECDVVLHDPCVSRCHAFLTVSEDGSIEFEDANSTNGSFFIDGDQQVRISSKQLQRDQPEACLKLGKELVTLEEIMRAIHTKIGQERGDYGRHR